MPKSRNRKSERVRNIQRQQVKNTYKNAVLKEKREREEKRQQLLEEIKTKMDEIREIRKRQAKEQAESSNNSEGMDTQELETKGATVKESPYISCDMSEGEDSSVEVLVKINSEGELEIKG